MRYQKIKCQINQVIIVISYCLSVCDHHLLRKDIPDPDSGIPGGDEGSDDGDKETDKVSPFMCTPFNSDKFEKQILYSCEFDRGFDTEYWENPKDDKFATWTFFPENVETRDGKLELKIKYYKHKRGYGGKPQN